MKRRSFLASSVAALALGSARVSAQTTPQTLLAEARALAASVYVTPSSELPPPFDGLSYDAYRGIRPVPGKAAMLPLGPDYAVDLLPPGLYFQHPVEIELPTETGFARLPVSPDLFTFEPRYFDSIPETSPGAGFSGLRLRYPLNRADTLDEVLVVQGASYFRAIGQAMAYGLSARAVALGTGGPVPEEFPRFTRLRLHGEQDGAVRMEAVIDSPSLAGHLDMTLRPGTDTVMDIAVTLMPRREIADIGVAPLTSMYLKGPMRSAVSDDFRPRVHDSDVLVIKTGGGEEVWRPIANPARVETSAFLDNGPEAFGLWQTARTFEDFQDSEARYHDRPSALVEPLDDWGSGAVMLVEIPTGDEFMDNIVAFWRPLDPLAAGSEHRFAYRLSWTRAAPPILSPMPIRQSRSGREHDRPGTRRFVVDFAGTATGLSPDLSATTGEISGKSLYLLPDGRGTRMTFLLAPGDIDTVDLRLVLRDNSGAAASPVWLYRWTRARDGDV